MNRLYLCENCRRLTKRALVKVEVSQLIEDDKPAEWLICYKCLEEALEDN
jgi:hypothetical protein